MAKLKASERTKLEFVLDGDEPEIIATYLTQLGYTIELVGTHIYYDRQWRRDIYNHVEGFIAGRQYAQGKGF